MQVTLKQQKIMCIKVIDNLLHLLFHEIAMNCLNLNKKSNICVLVLKVVILILTNVHVHVATRTQR